MNKYFLKIMCICIFFFSLTTSQVFADQKIISVVGNSEFEHDAELIKIHFAIANQTNTDLQQAKEEVEKISSNIAHSLVKLGINENDIVSSAFRVDSNRPYRNGCPEKPIPVVERNIEVRLKKIKLYQKTIDSLVANGVTSIRRIESDLINRKKYEQKAMLAAIKDAKEQAKFLVEGFDAKLGDVHRIGERTVQHIPLVPEMMTRSVTADGVKPEPYEFKPMPVTITAKVHVEYEIQ